MKLLDAETMFEAVQPMNLVLLFIGVPFFVIQKKNSPKFESQTNAIFIIYAIMGFIGFWWSTYQILTTGETAINLIHGSPLFKYGDRFKVFSDFLVVFVIILDAIWNKNALSRHLDNLIDVDNTWKVLGLTKNYGRMKRRFILALLLQNFMHLSQVISSTALMYSWMKNQAFSILFAMFAPGYLYTALLTIYGSSLGQTRLNFEVINSELELICENSLLTKTGADNACLNVEETFLRQKQLLQDLCSVSRDEIVIQRLTVYWHIYDKLCDDVDSLNRYFFLKVFFILGVSFSSMVINVFVGLNALVWIARNQSDERMYFFMSYSFCQGALNFFNIFMTIVVCQFCQKTVSLHKEHSIADWYAE